MKHVIFLFFYLLAEPICAKEFSAVILSVNPHIKEQSYTLDADIHYKLSPTVNEALQKGISLTWTVVIKVKRKGVLWDQTLKQIELIYQIQNHALLNSYSVKNLISGERDMFSTLAGALDFISKIRGVTLVDKQLIDDNQQYSVGIKVNFKHEALPVPIRPFSYFDSQWALSSSWRITLLSQ